jgi:hypothetical protein
MECDENRRPGGRESISLKINCNQNRTAPSALRHFPQNPGISVEVLEMIVYCGNTTTCDWAGRGENKVFFTKSIDIKLKLR